MYLNATAKNKLQKLDFAMALPHPVLRGALQVSIIKNLAQLHKS